MSGALGALKVSPLHDSLRWSEQGVADAHRPMASGPDLRSGSPRRTLVVLTGSKS
ncbi:hypothetical protein Ga0074812_14727 [Parafrankia irregularis]|uniref:Uncharacterized protein n=1 Tax=Parafrankia irregularis TaxID=795642 RepID=A0A0S4QZ05_9ACTN|nr:hypothetical protein Ga0074812_14727 [Parafrankia irregularis]